MDTRASFNACGNDGSQLFLEWEIKATWILILPGVQRRLRLTLRKSKARDGGRFSNTNGSDFCGRFTGRLIDQEVLVRRTVR